MPAHDHGFPEECLVLQGEITIGDITVCAGDYHFAAKGARHGTLTTRTGALLFCARDAESRSPSSPTPVDDRSPEVAQRNPGTRRGGGRPRIRVVTR